MTRSCALLAMVLALSGCASDGVSELVAGMGIASADAEPAERLAVALEQASRAAAQRDVSKLNLALAEIDALGGRPEGEHDAAQLESWRKAGGSPAAPMRGRTLGRGFSSGTVAPGQSTTLEQTFLSGRKASIALSAGGDRELGLTVRNGQDETVCDKRAQHAACSWIPLYTQRHTIRLANPGRAPVSYYLVVD